MPDHLWPKRDFDIGPVKSAKPVGVDLAPGEALTYCRQYPLKPEADERINKTGLIKVGVLVETQSPCNIKYRLVHDLRVVNDKVQDKLAEVTNPHMLLTNASPHTKFFTVIDLCLASFSIPLAEDLSIYLHLHIEGIQDFTRFSSLTTYV